MKLILTFCSVKKVKFFLLFFHDDDEKKTGMEKVYIPHENPLKDD